MPLQLADGAKLYLDSGNLEEMKGAKSKKTASHYGQRSS